MIGEQKNMLIPTELIPYCPKCGKPMTMNLRCDETFVQDASWYKAAERYDNFVHRYSKSNILFLELGVGANTPAIIKYPFWQMTEQYPNATYACINLGECYLPVELKGKSICIDSDIAKVLVSMCKDKS